MLRRICGPKRDEVTREWKRLHNEELNDLYSSPNIPNIVRVIKSRRMRWTRHVARMEERWGVYMFVVRKLGEEDYFEDPGVDRRIILRWISMKWDGGVDWIELAQDRDRWRAL
jgi:hypothetical protein